jgi:GNAT superfamily N-acetyltransferase
VSDAQTGEGRPATIERLSARHDIADFDCGVPPLNEWLSRHALVSQASGATQIYVGIRAQTVLGFYALAAGSVEPARASRRVAMGLGRYPVPVVVLARLAVDQRAQRRGVGAALLKDALYRVAGAADIIGVRALLVQAKDEAARRFYERFDFEASPTDPLHLFLLMKDLRRALKRAEGH